MAPTGCRFIIGKTNKQHGNNLISEPRIELFLYSFLSRLVSQRHFIETDGRPRDGIWIYLLWHKFEFLFTTFWPPKRKHAKKWKEIKNRKQIKGSNNPNTQTLTYTQQIVLYIHRSWQQHNNMCITHAPRSSFLTISFPFFVILLFLFLFVPASNKNFLQQFFKLIYAYVHNFVVIIRESWVFR